MKNLTPREVIEQVRLFIETRNNNAFIDLFDENGIIELPFSLDSNQRRYEGIDKIRERWGASSPMGKLLEFHKVSVVVYESTDPEVVTVEFTTEGKSLATDELFSFPSSIGIVRVRNGKIIHYRDYPNVLQGVKAAGMMQQYAASLMK